ncbi:hypothetical protein T01_3827 [Trichinella spiralis]|uniref:Uncharacterized protein n=1 Tax=Trichinella spiralis TaxID=6334 RepID=A0A0V1BQK9_TRISP|nr:hypothetical protein T01_3827 [Trichinella spiralis]
MSWQTASQLTNSIAFSVIDYVCTKKLKLYLACSVKDFGGELLIQNGIQRRILVITNVQIQNIIVENVNMKCIKLLETCTISTLMFLEEMLKLFRPVDRGELSLENAKNVAIHWTNIVQNCSVTSEKNNLQWMKKIFSNNIANKIIYNNNNNNNKLLLLSSTDVSALANRLSSHLLNLFNIDDVQLKDAPLLCFCSILFNGGKRGKLVIKNHTCTTASHAITPLAPFVADKVHTGQEWTEPRQERCRRRKPLPQVREHTDHGLHSVHPLPGSHALDSVSGPRHVPSP